MLMRLAFAVSTCMEPDILIVDEALSVGDAIFQAKCYSRIRKMMANGTSLLFVSHSIETVQSICSKVFWINHGRMEFFGDAGIVCDRYNNFCLKKVGVDFENFSDEKKIKIEERYSDSNFHGSNFPDVPKSLLQENPNFKKLAADNRKGTGAVRIKNFILTDQSGMVKDSFEYNEKVNGYCLFEVNENLDTEFNIGLMIKKINGMTVLTICQITEIVRLKAEKGGIYISKYTFNLPLHHDDYYMRLDAVGFKNGFSSNNGIYSMDNLISFDQIEKAIFFKVKLFDKYPVPGPVQPHHQLEVGKV